MGGAPIGFHRNSRGRGGYGGQGQGGPNMRGNFRGRHGGQVPGRPTAAKKETLKFDSEYDFEQANEQFEEVLKKLQVLLNDDKVMHGSGVIILLYFAEIQH